MVSEAVGVLVAVVVQGQLVTKYRKSDDCSDSGEVPDSELDKEVHAILYNFMVHIVIDFFLKLVTTLCPEFLFYFILFFSFYKQ